MRKNIHKLLIRICSVGLILSLIAPEFRTPVYADDEVIVVSLGDSYASGEGIEPYYGQEKDFEEKITDENWLAHRSQNSWASMLEIPGIDGALGDYWSENLDKPSGCTWYFKAASGATTQDVINNGQSKEVKSDESTEYTHSLPVQTDILSGLKDKVDYVTLSIGGNDVGFSAVIKYAATHAGCLNINGLKQKLSSTYYSKKTTVTANIQSVYDTIYEAAGSQANVIVAGYPRLLATTPSSLLFGSAEAEQINNAVLDFNTLIEKIVNYYNTEGKNFYFANIQEWFDDDGEHGAYTLESFAFPNAVSWINGVVMPVVEEDLDQSAMFSSASFHPNEAGALAYAECINKLIEDIQTKKAESAKGTICGKVCKASEKSTAIPNASIVANKENTSIKREGNSDSCGEYSMELPIGSYRVDVSLEGYIPCSYYTSILKDEVKYEEVLLLVEGTEGTTGTATGTIRNALTSNGVEGVSLSFHRGWNNTDHGMVIATATSNSDGSYSVDMEIGNYTLIAEKDGYVTATKNIIVQNSSSGSQDCSISPTFSDENYRIILTWGENPRDLDSHMVGTLSSGITCFHVFFSYKSQYDGEIEVCNLDVDDTTSYGPETITLSPTSTEPYYYYIHRYAGDGYISTSTAQIKVYHGGELIKTYNAPTSLGDSDYWNVFAIVNGELVSKNTITSSPDISYVSSSSNSLSMSMSNVFAFDGLPKKESAKEDTEDSTEEDAAGAKDEASEETSTETAADSETTEEEIATDATESPIVEETLLEADPEKTLRMVLTWGENPRDLDSHVVGTLSDGNPFHVYYGYVLECDDIVEVCSLDTDETSGNGTETIVLNPVTDTPYYYYIYKYAGSGDISTSGAQITVYQGEDILQVFDVPTDQGAGDYWNVFAVVNGELVVKNTVTETADRTYADPTEESEAEGDETEEGDEIVDNLPAKDIPLEELLDEDTSETEELTEEEQILEETIDDLEEQILSELSELEESASEQETDEPEAAETVTTEKESTEEAATHGKRSKRKPAA